MTGEGVSLPGRLHSRAGETRSQSAIATYMHTCILRHVLNPLEASRPLCSRTSVSERVFVSHQNGW